MLVSVAIYFESLSRLFLGKRSERKLRLERGIRIRKKEKKKEKRKKNKASVVTSSAVSSADTTRQWE